jgi:hypothetical protein
MLQRWRLPMLSRRIRNAVSHPAGRSLLGITARSVSLVARVPFKPPRTMPTLGA